MVYAYPPPGSHLPLYWYAYRGCAPPLCDQPVKVLFSRKR
ncbi:hypothetical protein ASZ90_016809 [hydrocarbon metagenome]|uniref:Uncharacterized protein n=1 Tax=hydrocarbon metagenome TaxID=938273 RepID=A0A0W8EB00_9ZZZZ